MRVYYKVLLLKIRENGFVGIKTIRKGLDLRVEI